MEPVSAAGCKSVGELLPDTREDTRVLSALAGEWGRQDKRVRGARWWCGHGDAPYVLMKGGCSGGRDDPAILSCKGPGKHGVTIFAKTVLSSYPCSLLLLSSSEARVFTINELWVCWEKNRA